jgi:hypothetical protein
MKEMQTFEELESPVILFSSPSMCALLNYRVVPPPLPTSLVFSCTAQTHLSCACAVVRVRV